MDQPQPPVRNPWGMNVNTYCMLLHLSQLSGFAFPPAGLALPVILWAANKDNHPEVDAHGRRALNWMLSLFVYFPLSLVLTIVVVGIPMLIALLALAIVFPVIGAVKAHEGVHWDYPMAICFLKEPDER